MSRHPHQKEIGDRNFFRKITTGILSCQKHGRKSCVVNSDQSRITSERHLLAFVSSDNIFKSIFFFRNCVFLCHGVSLLRFVPSVVSEKSCEHKTRQRATGQRQPAAIHVCPKLWT